MAHDRASTREIRYTLTLHLQDRAGQATVPELAAAAAAAGLRLPEAAGKLISDALRTEVSRGRVRRRGRGVYAAGMVPKSTRRYFEAWLGWSIGGCRGPAPR